MYKLPQPQVLDNDEDSLNFERGVFFSDAVIAIAITLLALEIRLPEVEPVALPQALLALPPEIGVYALSFLIVGIYWVSHHRIFRYLARYDWSKRIPSAIFSTGVWRRQRQRYWKLGLLFLAPPLLW